MAILAILRARDLVVHGPAHRGANGAAMPTDEDDHDGHFFYNHPESVLVLLGICSAFICRTAQMSEQRDAQSQRSQSKWTEIIDGPNCILRP